MPSRLAWVLSCVFLAACAAPVPADEARGEEASELRDKKPRYSLESAELLGEYANDEGCPGGFDACEQIRLRRTADGAGLEVSIGGYEQWYARGLVAPVQATQSGVLVFTTGELPNELPWADCQDPGCGNILKVSGVIYPVAQGDTWIPRLKATFTLDFPYPDEDGAPEGELREVRYFGKRTQ